MTDTRKKLPFYKRRYLINPQFQITFVGYMLAQAAITVGVFFGVNLYFFDRFLKLGNDSGMNHNHPFFEFLAIQQATMNWLYAAAGAFVFVFLFITGILISHRVAGPLFRLKRHMRQIASGEAVEPVKFRQKDFFQDLAEAFNEQLEERETDHRKSS